MSSFRDDFAIPRVLSVDWTLFDDHTAAGVVRAFALTLNDDEIARGKMSVVYGNPHSGLAQLDRDGLPVVHIGTPKVVDGVLVLATARASLPIRTQLIVRLSTAVPKAVLYRHPLYHENPEETAQITASATQGRSARAVRFTSEE
jgi:hypothetical protein